MEEELSFKTTNEELAAGIEDEYEVLYSKDGKEVPGDMAGAVEG